MQPLYVIVLASYYIDAWDQSFSSPPCIRNCMFPYSRANSSNTVLTETGATSGDTKRSFKLINALSSPLCQLSDCSLFFLIEFLDVFQARAYLGRMSICTHLSLPSTPSEEPGPPRFASEDPTTMTLSELRGSGRVQVVNVFEQRPELGCAYRAEATLSADRLLFHHFSHVKAAVCVGQDALSAKVSRENPPSVRLSS